MRIGSGYQPIEVCAGTGDSMEKLLRKIRGLDEVGQKNGESQARDMMSVIAASRAESAKKIAEAAEREMASIKQNMSRIGESLARAAGRISEDGCVC